MMKMDIRGQISIEFILIVAFMLVLVLLIGNFALDETEKITITSEARTGAMDAASNLLLLNRSIQPLRVEDVNIPGNSQNLTIFIDISGTISNSTNETITNKTLQSLANQGYTLNTTNSTDQFVVTGRHIYRIKIV